MNLNILRTDSNNEDFMKLKDLLDEDLNNRYGELQEQYNKYNEIDYIKDVVIIYRNDIPIACGGWKEHDENTIELKRVFVIKENRKQGISKLIINNLEQLGKEKGYKYAILETGKKQYEAINLYESNGYEVIENYGPYLGNTNSICMKKRI